MTDKERPRTGKVFRARPFFRLISLMLVCQLFVEDFQRGDEFFENRRSALAAGLSQKKYLPPLWWFLPVKNVRALAPPPKKCGECHIFSRCRQSLRLCRQRRPPSAARRREDAHFFIGRRRDFLRATFFCFIYPAAAKKQAPLNFSISQRQIEPVAGHAHRTVVQRAKPLSVIFIVINTQKRRQNIRSVQQFFLRQNNPVRKCPLKAFKGQ